MSKSGTSSAKIGLISSLFCLTAGLLYGVVESTYRHALSDFGKGLLAFSTTLFFFAIVFSFIANRSGKRWASMILLAAYTLNIGSWVFVQTNCVFTMECRVTPEDLQH